jgi:hypothetical protein
MTRLDFKMRTEKSRRRSGMAGTTCMTALQKMGGPTAMLYRIRGTITQASTHTNTINWLAKMGVARYGNSPYTCTKFDRRRLPWIKKYSEKETQLREK